MAHNPWSIYTSRPGCSICRQRAQLDEEKGRTDRSPPVHNSWEDNLEDFKKRWNITEETRQTPRWRKKIVYRAPIDEEPGDMCGTFRQLEHVRLPPRRESYDW